MPPKCIKRLSEVSSVLTSRISKSRRVLLDLLERQGFDCSEYRNGCDKADVENMYKDNELDMLVTKKQEQDEPTPEVEGGNGKDGGGKDAGGNGNKKGKDRVCSTYVHYHTHQPLKEKQLQYIVHDLFEEIDELTGVPMLLKETDTLIVIKNMGKPNDAMIRILNHLWEREGVFVIIMSLQYLQFNVLDHVLVPEHTVISEEEVSALRAKYKFTDEQCPVISRFDPVAQQIGIRPGQICRIARPSKTAVESIAYRICM